MRRAAEVPPGDGYQHIDWRPLLTMFKIPHGVTGTMPKEYTLAGETKALYNGAQDTDGGIWVRIRDENDRRLAQAAVDKQLKNNDAAKGTLSALDPNSGHLLDYVAEALGRIKDGLNGARPSGAQLDGTPMGAAIAGSPGSAGTAPPADGGKKPAKDKRGGKPSSVGEVLKTVENGPLSPTPTPAGGINWSEHVPTPRPEAGQTIRTAQGVNTTIKTPIGYDGEAGAFRVMDTDKWMGLVYWYEPGKVWRVTSQALDYRDDEPAPAPAPAVEDFPENALDAVPEPEPELPAAPSAPPPVSPQRARNTRHAGLGKPDGKLPATPKATPAAKKSAAKKRR